MGNNHGFSAPSYAAQYNCIITVVMDVAEGEGRVVEVQVEGSSASSSSAMKVGELLLEFSPGHFVAHFSRSCFPFLPPPPHSHAATATSSSSSSSAASPCLLERASALGADADAMAGAAHVYVLLPMSRLHTRLSPQERLTIARLLHNHAAKSHPPTQSDHNQFLEGNNPATKYKPAQLLRRLLKRSRACNAAKLQAGSLLWGRCGGAARVAPHDDQQELSNGFKGTNIAKKQLAEEEEEEKQDLQSEQYNYSQVSTMPKLPVVMMKAKPWAPKLETISEELEGCS
ncbi:hypothetical protein L7F22_002386 [Adiantum nelumboides]|nr:hypothetical protein [Adiantum nelumboides]